MNIKLGSLLCLSLILASCGKLEEKFGRKSDEYTTVTFERARTEGFDALDTMNGGIMIYAYSPSYTTNLVMSSEGAATPSITLPNGDYSFYAFGYSSQPSQGTDDTEIRCAVIGSRILNGASQSVVLELAKANCSNGIFTGNNAFPAAGTPGTFPAVEVVHCGTSNYSSFSALNSTQNCGTSGSGAISALPDASLARVKFSFPIFKNSSTGFSIIGSGIQSACSNSSANTLGGAVANFMRIPVGSPNLPFSIPVEIQSFTDTACTSSPLQTHRFHRGLVFGPDPDGPTVGKVLYNGSSLKTRIFLRQ